MRLKYLFKIQNIIDNEIRRTCQQDGPLLDRQHLIKTQILALEVKTGELANLTKCYKYPREMREVDKRKLIIRYVECFKFLISIGNDNHYNVINFSVKELIDSVTKEPQETIVDIFLSLFDNIANLKRDLFTENYISGINVYMTIFKELVLLGQLLGLTFEDVFDYYDKLYRDMVQTS
ncbi:MAG: dUTP diphosphatase [Candidatus Euphemobacter frigidus]|nr:dUTP diphosphatase [Candidatus Euphemobacter frigidus]MDP8276024.1 dUTP diphosphatase [Candidatus Euphemobacter frigidus]